MFFFPQNSYYNVVAIDTSLQRKQFLPMKDHCIYKSNLKACSIDMKRWLCYIILRNFRRWFWVEGHEKTTFWVCSFNFFNWKKSCNVFWFPYLTPPNLPRYLPLYQPTTCLFFLSLIKKWIKIKELTITHKNCYKTQYIETKLYKQKINKTKRRKSQKK